MGPILRAVLWSYPPTTARASGGRPYPPGAFFFSRGRESVMFRALRWLGTAFLFIFFLALPAQHLLENKAMAVPPFMNISGAVTLGTGSGASNGDVNVTDYNDDFGMAMNALLEHSERSTE